MLTTLATTLASGQDEMTAKRMKNGEKYGGHWLRNKVEVRFNVLVRINL